MSRQGELPLGAPTPAPAPAPESQPEPAASAPRVQVFTDGSCHGNPGPGGWAAIIEQGASRRELSGAQRATTNNQMELRGAIEGLRALAQASVVDLYSDSQYVVNGMKSWIHDWKRRGWRTADRKPVKNEELWRALDAEAQRHRVRWHWVRGHDGHPQNERADALANAAITELEARR